MELKPNGWEDSVMPEGLGLDYNVHIINLMAGKQKVSDDLKPGSNRRVPMIVRGGFSFLNLENCGLLA